MEKKGPTYIDVVSAKGMISNKCVSNLGSTNCSVKAAHPIHECDDRLKHPGVTLINCSNVNITINEPLTKPLILIGVKDMTIDKEPDQQLLIGLESKNIGFVFRNCNYGEDVIGTKRQNYGSDTESESKTDLESKTTEKKETISGSTYQSLSQNSTHMIDKHGVIDGGDEHGGFIVSLHGMISAMIDEKLNHIHRSMDFYDGQLESMRYVQREQMSSRY